MRIPFHEKILTGLTIYIVHILKQNKQTINTRPVKKQERKNSTISDTVYLIISVILWMCISVILCTSHTLTNAEEISQKAFIPVAV